MPTNPEREDANLLIQHTCRKFTGALVAISMLIAFLFVANLYTLNRLNSTQREEGNLRAGLAKGITELKGENQALLSKYVLLRDSHAQEIAELRNELDHAATQLGSSSGRVLDRARGLVGALQKVQDQQIDNLQDQLAQKADTQDLSELNEGITSDSSRLGATEKTMGVLAQDLGAARSELGEVDASTQQQIQALQEKIEGQYYDFTLEKNRPFHVGRIALTLRKTNARKKVFNLDVVANDRDIHHASHNVDEPIYFYLGRSPIPYELVITSVVPDGVAGYIRIPKVDDSSEQPAPRI